MQSELGSSRFKPLPAGEREICWRLAAIRRFEGFEQAGLGQRLGITRDQVANIENARVPLKADVALRFCLMLNVNPLWLAKGTGQPKYFAAPSFKKIIAEASPPAIPFSIWFDEFLAPVFSKLSKVAERQWERTKAALKLASENLPGLKQTTENREMVLQEAKILEQSIRIRKRSLKDAERIRGFAELSKAAQNQSLTESSEVRIVSSDMESEMRKITLQKVLANVRLLVSARGMKAKLAADLDVPQPRVSEWLAGKYKPSGETALRLAHWVELQGRQSK